jgi:hypothetical protein
MGEDQLPELRASIDAAVRKELDRIAAEKGNSAQVDVDTTGIEGSIATEKWGARFMAYVRKKWRGETVAGARIEKKF